MQPSTDDLPGKKPPERGPRRGGGRKPGKQPGAPGAFLAWQEVPDDTIPHFPRGTCECGADLADARDLGVRYSHQVTDLPEARATHRPSLEGYCIRLGSHHRVANPCTSWPDTSHLGDKHHAVVTVHTMCWPRGCLFRLCSGRR